MKRVRLQIQVLPWEESTSQPSRGARGYEHDIRPWLQPEDADNTLQQLVDNIVHRFGRIYIGRGYSSRANPNSLYALLSRSSSGPYESKSCKTHGEAHLTSLTKLAMSSMIVRPAVITSPPSARSSDIPQEKVNSSILNVSRRCCPNLPQDLRNGH